MKKSINLFRICICCLCQIVMLGSYTTASSAADWPKLKAKEIDLFYPGQASWEWAVTQESHVGAAMIRQGQTCRACHSGQEQLIGANIIGGGKLEPHAIKDMPGTIKVQVKTARDDNHLYIRLSWPASGDKSTTAQTTGFQSKVSIFFDDGKVRDAARAGCWAACHSDNSGMSNAVPTSMLTKYLPQSRSKMTRTGGGESYKSEKDLSKLLKDGIFQEYWLAELNADKPAVVSDGYILDKRHNNKLPMVSATAQIENNQWIVTFRRALRSTEPQRKSFENDKTYNLGIAVHNNHTEGRRHYVSFEHSLVLDKGKSDFIAVKSVKAP